MRVFEKLSVKMTGGIEMEKFEDKVNSKWELFWRLHSGKKNGYLWSTGHKITPLLDVLNRWSGSSMTLRWVNISEDIKLISLWGDEDNE